jgi:uncharacterized membrane protein YgcG
MCTSFMDPSVLEALLVNRSVGLSKPSGSGIRPIGIGEMPRRIMTKAVLHVLRADLLHATGVVNLCAGQKAGIDAIVHAVQQFFGLQSTEGVLLGDASSAFQTLNRRVALHNIRTVCPPLSTILINCYRKPTRCFFSDGTHFLSQEGTTQGDPLALVMYACALMPLVAEIRKDPKIARMHSGTFTETPSLPSLLDSFVSPTPHTNNSSKSSSRHSKRSKSSSSSSRSSRGSSSSSSSSSRSSSSRSSSSSS